MSTESFSDCSTWNAAPAEVPVVPGAGDFAAPPVAPVDNFAAAPAAAPRARC